ncbi:MAG: cysteine-rich small domain-containing protein [Pyramidobacter sp.]|nr:cysteine-rich small domain-containing protein [Pyramidobacter sp.]
MSEKPAALNTKPEDCKYSFFSHKECEFFPCHKGADPENFNCLFCYCPLYALGRECGGNFRYLDSGIKDCTNCLLPHSRKSYSVIVSRFMNIVEAMKKIELSREEKTPSKAESGK